MGSYLITPVKINGVPLCVDPASRRTVAVLTGDTTTEVGDDLWEVLRVEPETLAAIEGEVVMAFGCGVTSATFRFSGTHNTEPFAPRLLWLYVNGTLWDDIVIGGTPVYDFKDLLADLSAAYPASHGGGTATEEDGFDLTIAFTERPCGNIVRLSGICPPLSEGLDDVWWRMRLVGITTG